MRKILFIDQITDEKSENVDHLINVARSNKADLSAIFVIPVSVETTDWIKVHEKQIKEAEEKVKQIALKVEEQLKQENLSISWKIVHSVPSAFLKAIEDFCPVDVIIVGNIDLDPYAEKGIKHMEDISAMFNCPVLPLVSLLPDKRKAKNKLLTRFIAFGALSAASYLLFFPNIDVLNHQIYMKGTILGALAVLLTVPIHAYIYGSFTECITKIIGLEKSIGNH